MGFFVCLFILFQGIEMAKLFESHVKRDPNFEVPAERHLGLVVFCLKVRDENSTQSRSIGGLSVLFCYLRMIKLMNTFANNLP